mgnify:CR=1 FL=1
MRKRIILLVVVFVLAGWGSADAQIPSCSMGWAVMDGTMVCAFSVSNSFNSHAAVYTKNSYGQALGGVEVLLSGRLELSAYTDERYGETVLIGLPRGEYILGVRVPEGYTLTSLVEKEIHVYHYTFEDVGTPTATPESTPTLDEEPTLQPTVPAPTSTSMLTPTPQVTAEPTFPPATAMPEVTIPPPTVVPTRTFAPPIKPTPQPSETPPSQEDACIFGPYDTERGFTIQVADMEGTPLSGVDLWLETLDGGFWEETDAQGEWIAEEAVENLLVTVVASEHRMTCSAVTMGGNTLRVVLSSLHPFSLALPLIQR